MVVALIVTAARLAPLGAVWALFAIHTAGVEQQPSTSPTGLILGRVIDLDTKTPVAGAVVTLGCSGANPLLRDRVRTDPQGRFAAFDVVPGLHTLCVSSVGYAPSPVKRLDLKPGQLIGDILLPISRTRAAAISGRVIDENGERAVNVRVVALGRQGAGGFWLRGSARTDDRGMYRIAGLNAEEYLVMIPSAQITLPASVADGIGPEPSPAEPLQRQLAAIGIRSGQARAASEIQTGGVRLGSATQLLDSAARPPQRGESGPWLVYPSIFFGSGTSRGRLGVLSLTTGEDCQGIDFHLRTVPASRVTGALIGAGRPARMWR